MRLRLVTFGQVFRRSRARGPGSGEHRGADHLSSSGVHGPNDAESPEVAPAVPSAEDVEELAAMLMQMHGASPFYEALVDVDVADSLRELELPHVVVCRDRQSGFVSLQGPYADGLSALYAAERENADNDEDRPFDYSVLPVLPGRSG